MNESGLIKKLSFWHIWAIGVGAVVGDGIFYLVGQGATTAGPSSAFAYLFAGLVMMMIMMSMCELSVGMPSAGSIHLWSRRVLGPGYGTVAGLSYTLMNITFLGSVSIANGIVSNYFFQWTDNATVSAAIWAILLLTIVTAMGLTGAEIAGKAQFALVAVLTSIMLLFAISGIVSGRIDPANYQPMLPYGFTGFMAATGLGLYAYMGPLVLLTAGGEVKDIKILPKAMFWAFITFLVLYTSSMLVMLGLVNYSEFAQLESPFTYAAAQVFGNYAGLIMNCAAWIAAFTCLIGEIYGSSRLLYGMSLEGALPKIFTKMTKKSGVPLYATLLPYIIAVALVLMANFGALSSIYVTLCMVGVGLGVMTWFITLITAAKYKSAFPKEWSKLEWKLPAKFRKIIFPVAFLGCLTTFYMIFSSDPISIIYTGGTVIILSVFYKVYSKPRMTTGKENEAVETIQ